MGPRITGIVILSIVLVAVLVGCARVNDSRKSGANSRSNRQTAAKSVSGERRTTLKSLTSRLPALGTPKSAIWYSGTLGDSRAPGASTYWIDAVIALDSATEAELRALPAKTTSGTPDVTTKLADAVPTGTFRTGPDLDARLSHKQWDVTTWLAEDKPILVVSVVGGN